MSEILILVFVASFTGAFLGSLFARGLPNLQHDLHERSKLKAVLPQQTFHDQWGRNVPAYLWKHYGPHRRN